MSPDVVGAPVPCVAAGLPLPRAGPSRLERPRESRLAPLAIGWRMHRPFGCPKLALGRAAAGDAAGQGVMGLEHKCAPLCALGCRERARKKVVRR